MIDISFKNKTGAKPDILSAVIGADSFFYGLFTKDFNLLEANYYEKVDFTSHADISRIKKDLYKVDHLEIKVSSSLKPYLHLGAEDDMELLPFYPAFQNKDVYSDSILNQESVVNYGLVKSHKIFLKELLGDHYRQVHLSTVFSDLLYPFKSNKIAALLDDDRIHILYGDEIKFKYYNQFACAGKNDFLYFIQLAYKELGLDTQKDTLLIGGRIDDGFPVYDLIYGYINKVQLFSSTQMFIQDLEFRGKQHFYMDLYATAICG